MPPLKICDDGVKFWCSTLAILSGCTGKPLIRGCKAGRGIGRISETDWGCRVQSSAGGRAIRISLDVGCSRKTSSVGIETLRGLSSEG